MDNLTVFVNSSDGFEDCWDPFFHLFQFYTNELNKKVVLNTEYKSYFHPSINIKCTKVNELSSWQKLTWSEATRIGLEQIESDFVLYLQEDYFLKSQVDEISIGRYLKLMERTNDISCIQLTDIGSIGPFYASDYNGLAIIPTNAKYRISTQAALWRKDVLLKYLKDWESGWLFEIFGTLRAEKGNETFLAFSREQNNEMPISYVATGIIKGKWNLDVPELMAKHSIDINYKDRGFVSMNLFLQKILTLKKIFEKPKSLIRSIISILN